MTIIKMILFNMHKLLSSCRQVQDEHFSGHQSNVDAQIDQKTKKDDLLTHKLQIINIEEE